MTFFTQEVMVFTEMAEWFLSSVRKSFCVEGFRERSETWMNLRSALIGQFNLALAPASLGSAVTCQCRAMPFGLEFGPERWVWSKIDPVPVSIDWEL